MDNQHTGNLTSEQQAQGLSFLHFDRSDLDSATELNTMHVRNWGDIRLLATRTTQTDPYHAGGMPLPAYPLDEGHEGIDLSTVRFIIWFDSCLLPFDRIVHEQILTEVFSGFFHARFGPDTAPIAGMPTRGPPWERITHAQNWNGLFRIAEDMEPEAADYTERGSASPGSDTEISESKRCTICLRRQITIELSGCIHGLCMNCTKSYWWGRVRSKEHWPESFPCPFCRHEIIAVREVSNDGVFIPLREWMVTVSTAAAHRARR